MAGACFAPEYATVKSPKGTGENSPAWFGAAFCAEPNAGLPANETRVPLGTAEWVFLDSVRGQKLFKFLSKTKSPVMHWELTQHWVRRPRTAPNHAGLLSHVPLRGDSGMLVMVPWSAQKQRSIGERIFNYPITKLPNYQIPRFPAKLAPDVSQRPTRFHF
jgi:hypothetical protein